MVTVFLLFSAFESVWLGSWWPVKQLKIRKGYLIVSSVDGQHEHEACGPSTNLRVRSRKANSSDCTCYLRPGLDVCVLSPSSDGNSNNVSLQARYNMSMFYGLSYILFGIFIWRIVYGGIYFAISVIIIV